MNSFARLTLVALCIVLFAGIAVPSTAIAQDKGFEGSRFITCAGKDCQFADLIKLVDNIISFLLTIAVPLAAILFTYAGFLYVTSAANPGGRDKGKKIFTSVFIGLVIALGAYLFVNLLTTFFLSKDSIGNTDVEDILTPTKQ